MNLNGKNEVAVRSNGLHALRLRRFSDVDSVDGDQHVAAVQTLRLREATLVDTEEKITQCKSRLAGIRRLHCYT